MVKIVDFGAKWCGPCQMQGPILDDVARRRPDVEVEKVDVDAEPARAAAAGVASIPTLLVQRDGVTVRTFVGLTSAEDLLAALGDGRA